MQSVSHGALALVAAVAAATAAPCQPAGYAGRPFQDAFHPAAPQRIPGRVECACYDIGGEGVAYHTDDKRNQGSGALNKADGSYLNEFRMSEAVSISYTKFGRPARIDDNPFNLVTPPGNQLYVGWTRPGEWFNLTVEVERAGEYAVDLLYTSHQGGSIALEWDDRPLAGPIRLLSTFNPSEPIAWRNWHHWNLMKAIARVALPAGRGVVKVRVVSEGNMNLAYLDFSPVGPAPR